MMHGPINIRFSRKMFKIRDGFPSNQIHLNVGHLLRFCTL